MGSTWIDALVQHGIRDVFMAPGSRSTPLVLAAANHPAVRLHRHFDERALGYYALGCALAREAPVAIIVTSGTAVGNLLPAIMEAHHACVPLLVITADRPLELQDCSANQTTDQHDVFTKFVRWSTELDLLLPAAVVRSKIAHAVLRAATGPVHLNVPLREPLYPVTPCDLTGCSVRLEIAPSASPQRLDVASRGLLVVGRLPRRSDLHAVLELARRLQWPVLADLLSNGRATPTPEQIRHFDWLLADAPKPDVVLHFGERMTSKRLMQWLERARPPRYIHVSPQPHWNDPSALITERIVADVAPTCAAIHGRADAAWLSQWQTLDQLAAERLEMPFDEFTESAAMRSLAELVQGPVLLGSSMPIREAEWFLWPKNGAGPFFSNRGLSGIDGNIATAAGLSVGLAAPLTAIVGDLTALHDLGSLALLANAPHPVRLIISNNSGGGIFSHLPVAKDARFEELFAFEHGWTFEHAAKMFSLPYARVRSIETLRDALTESKSCVIELVTSRKRNIAFHEALKCSTACR